MCGEEEQKEIKVLLVDDEPDFLALITVFLAREKENFSIDTTSSAEEGMERLKDGKYDVVISDYQMPGMNGLEFLQNLRQSGSTIPFIMLTGKGREVVAMEALNKGANHYLPKGEDAKSMYGTLAHVIRKEVEKKRTEDKLAEVEKERQIILDSLPTMIFHIDRDSTFIYVNKLLADVCEMNAAYFKGKSTREIFSEEAESYIKSDKELVKSGRPKIGIIGEFRTPKGKRWVRTDKIPLKDADGNVTSIIGSAVDITEHKKAEEMLQESEKLRNNILSTSPIGIGVVEMGPGGDRKLGWTNQNMMTMFGFEPHEDHYIGLSTSVIYASEEEYERVSQILKENFEKGKIAEVDAKLKRKDGSLFDGYITICFIDPSDHAKGAVATISDISRRKHAEEELRTSEKQLRETKNYLNNVIESSADTITVVDMNGIVRDWNKSAEGIMDYRADEVIGTSNSKFFADSEEADRIKERVLREGEVKNYRTTVLRKDGKPVHISMSASLLKDKNGVPIGIVCVSRDITEQKRAEEEREGLIKELEAKNAEMERFTYTVSHDLRSPLVTIHGFASTLQNDIGQNNREKVEADLKFIKEATTKMDRLLSDTLQLSRIGRVVNPPEDVPFGELVQEALEQTAEDIKSSGVEVSAAEDFPTVQVDRIRIIEVLVNLIENCIKYRGEQPHHPKIDIGYRVDGEETVFFVKDNGIGIDKSQHEKVFGLFYKMDRNSKGTGAGLAIVKRIIEVHGGRIWIESEKGKGCAVCFALPLT